MTTSPLAWAVLPKPSAADFAIATAFADGDYRKQHGPYRDEREREDAIHQFAMLEMGKRTQAEFKLWSTQMPERPEAIPERVWERIQRVPNGCWEWSGCRDGKGYGQAAKVGGRAGTGSKYVHRLIYEALKGPIPGGLQIDHLCRNPPCCNPAHLEAVTPAENSRRGQTGLHKREKSMARTHCLRGHALTPENTMSHKLGHRNCRECQRNRLRAYRAGLARHSEQATA